LREGTRLNPGQRADFVNQAYQLMNAQLATQEKVNSRFQKFATEKGLRFAPEAWKLPPKPKAPPKPKGAESMVKPQDSATFGKVFKDLYKEGSDTFDQILKDVMSGD
jgi:hypothetical protein